MKCIKSTESKKLKVENIKNGRIIVPLSGVFGDSKKSRFIIEQEASGMLSSLGIITQVPLEGPILF